MKELNLSAGKPVLAARASQGTGSGSQLGLLRRYWTLADIKASDGLRMLLQAADFPAKSRAGNSDAKLESSSDFGGRLACGECSQPLERLITS